MEGAAVGREKERDEGSVDRASGRSRTTAAGKEIEAPRKGEGVRRTRTLAYSRGRGRGPNASIARIWAHSTASKRHAHAVSLIVVVARRASLPQWLGRRELRTDVNFWSGKKKWSRAVEPRTSPRSVSW